MRKLLYGGFAILIASVLGVTGAFGAPPAKTHRGNPSLRVLSLRWARTASAAEANDGLPSNAVLAASVGANNIYVFERAAGLEEQVCLADRFTAATAVACGPSGAVEREGLDLLLPNGGTASTVVALVPNGVKSVTFVSPNSEKAVRAVNNVVVSEGVIDAYSFVTPNGAVKTETLEA